MQKTKTKNQEEQLKKLNSLPDSEKEVIENMMFSDILFEAILDEIKIPEDDLFLRGLLYGTLVRQTRDHLIYAIWKNLSKPQIDHLYDFVNQYTLIHPEMSYDDVLIEFAQMYPELMDKVSASLDKFFMDFIENFNKPPKK